MIMDTSKIALIVDDDPEMRDSLGQLLTAAGWYVELSESAENALCSETLADAHVVLTDVRMPGRSGLDLMRELHANAKAEAPPVVLISAHGDIAMAVDAIQNGAYSFVEEPFDPHRLIHILGNAAEQHRLRKEAERLKRRLCEVAGLEHALPGSSELVTALREELVALQASNAPLMLIGETGLGKQLVARALHDIRAQTDSIFLTLSCNGLSTAALRELGPELLKLGEHGGTLLIDLIDSCSTETQSHLVQAIEPFIDRSQSNRRSVSLITTAQGDVRPAVDSGAFRADLYFQVSTIPISIPPLRERRTDITELHLEFLATLCDVYQVDLPLPTPDDTTRLMAYDWPGNVRELRNVVERQVLGAKRGNPSIATALDVDTEATSVPPTLRGAVAALERELITQAIKTNRGKMDATAEALGIGRRTLNDKIVKLGLDKSALI